MGTRSAMKTLKEARLKAGLTQSEIAEGICSLQSISRIETGVTGVSPGTFRSLMARVGSPCECFPVFADRNDFNCFHKLKQARFYVDVWQLDAALHALQQVEEARWAKNKLHYQEWLYLHCKLQFRSYLCDHSYNHERLLEALHVTRPCIDLNDFCKLILSQNEIQILTSLAQETLYLGQYQESLQLCTDIQYYLADSMFTALEKERTLAELAIVHVKCLISKKEYAAALKMADTHRHRMAVAIDKATLLELTFLTGLCCHYTDSPNAAAQIRAAFYSAHAIDSSYAAACLDYLLKKTDFPVSEYMRSLPPVPLHGFPACGKADVSGFHAGIFNADSKGVLPLGKLLHALRTEQNLSQAVLCHGLCSTSKLSKIESGALQPELALVEALLQRLGMSERMFTFWGNERDARFYELKFKITRSKRYPNEETEGYINEQAKLLKSTDHIYRQTYLFEKAIRYTAPEEKIAGLREALQITLPDFDIHKLLRYRLSWAELSILNNIAHELRNINISLSLLYFEQILEYLESANPDILLLTNIQPFTYQTYCHSLYINKIYFEMLVLHRKINLSVLRSHPLAYGCYLFYYSQTLGECSQFEAAKLAATQACYVEHMMELFKNASSLKSGIYQDFSIEIDY